MKVSSKEKTLFLHPQKDEKRRRKRVHPKTKNQKKKEKRQKKGDLVIIISKKKRDHTTKKKREREREREPRTERRGKDGRGKKSLSQKGTPLHQHYRPRRIVVIHSLSNARTRARPHQS